MSTDLADAVAPTCAAVAAVLAGLPDHPDVDLSTATPCAELDLRGLVEHFVGTSTAMARLGQHQPLDATDPWGGGQGAADGDWAVRLRSNLGAVGRGWGRPEAWSGEERVGSATFPRSMLGEMALIEVAVHGWDLARSLGRTLVLEPEVGAVLDQALAGTAELGRQMGAYGPEVPVPHGASDLDRALGRSGRDPGWAVRTG